MGIKYHGAPLLGCLLLSSYQAKNHYTIAIKGIIRKGFLAIQE